jgi:hypothetical protein
LGQIVEQVAREQGGVEIARRNEVADAVALMNAVAAELERRDALAGDRFDDARAGQEHAGALGHDHEVGERRRIGATASRGTADHRDLGHATG